MTLEDKLNELIELIDHGWCKVEEWTWSMTKGNVPMSINDLSNGGDGGDRKVQLITLKMDMLIYQTDSAVCSLSTSEYVRRCKQWMLQYNFQDVWVVAYKENV